MKKIIIESPFSGNIQRNQKYLRRCLNHSLLNGEAPFASHGLYTQEGVLNDLVPEERELGMNAGWEWVSSAELVAIYCDYGLSGGMAMGILKAFEKGIRTECRFLEQNVCQNCGEANEYFAALRYEYICIVCKKCGYEKFSATA